MSIIEALCRLRGAFLAGLACVGVALALQGCCWGFTVDDAWIVARVAAQGASTGSFAFNGGELRTDAVTPLGFAHFVAGVGIGLGKSSAREMWEVARYLGLGAYLLAFYIAGHLIGENRQGWRRFSGAGLTALCVPAAVWAGAGLSGSLVGLAVLVGAFLVEVRGGSKGERDYSRQSTLRCSLGYLSLGVAMAWRPELGPFVVGLALLMAVAPDSRSGRRWPAVFMGLPVLLVALLRWHAFGSWVPLSFTAKPPDLLSGIYYGAVTFLWAGVPWLVLSLTPLFCRKNLWVLTWCIHLLALVFAGGDWMPAMRLTAPLLPWFVWMLGRSLSFSWGRGRALVLIPAVLGPLVLSVSQGSDFRAVSERRIALIELAKPVLKGSQTVAAVDIGWVGLATDARIVDLAGVTDPAIASLPGGHTSKAIYPGLFSQRDIDTWVVRATDRSFQLGQPLRTVHASYWVDARLLARSADLGFIATATIPLRGTRGQYIIARRLEAYSAHP